MTKLLVSRPRGGAIRTVEEVARLLGCTPQAVQLVESRAFAKLRALWAGRDRDDVPLVVPAVPKECPICEAPILAPHTEWQITCSPECAGKRRRRLRVGQLQRPMKGKDP